MNVSNSWRSSTFSSVTCKRSLAFTYCFNSSDPGWYCEIKSKLYIVKLLFAKDYKAVLFDLKGRAKYLSRSRAVYSRGGNFRTKNTVLVGKFELSPSVKNKSGCGSSLIWPLTQSRSGCGRLLRHWCEGDDGKVEEKRKSLLLPIIPRTSLYHASLIILIGDWETSGDESGFDPKTPTQ